MMKTMLSIFLIALFLTFGFSGCGSSKKENAGSVSSNNPPSMEVIQGFLQKHDPYKQIGQFKVIGIHKEGEGKYLVFTNRNSNYAGGPYELYRLESNEWVISGGGIFREYQIIDK